MSAHYAAHLKSLLEVGWSSREVVNGELLVLKCWNVALVLGEVGRGNHTHCGLDNSIPTWIVTMDFKQQDR